MRKIREKAEKPSSVASPLTGSLGCWFEVQDEREGKGGRKKDEEWEGGGGVELERKLEAKGMVGKTSEMDRERGGREGNVNTCKWAVQHRNML